MKRIVAVSCVAAVLLAGLTLTTSLTAQESPQKGHQPSYKVIDLGTLGGTFALAGGMNDWGLVVGASTLPGDTAEHAFFWRPGSMTDLGTLGGPDSFATWPFNDWNQIAGGAETSEPDPNGEDYCGWGTYLICLPFLWQRGVMTPLPLLGGNNGAAYEINNWGVVAGEAETATAGSDCTPPQVLEPQAAFWSKGKVHELPTLAGDTAGAAIVINDLGQIAGISGTCTNRALHAVFWQNGTVIDMGNLGGTGNNSPNDINNRGQVVGYSNLSGDETAHAFLWGKRSGMKDLGTLAGDFSSSGDGINNLGQVVGGSCDADGNCRAYLWEKGVMTDLNTLIPPDSTLYLLEATGTINDLGEIAGEAYDTVSGEIHPFLLVPCGRGHGHVAGCKDRAQNAGAVNGALRQHRKIVLPENIRQMLQRYRGGKGSIRRF